VVCTMYDLSSSDGVTTVAGFHSILGRSRTIRDHRPSVTEVRWFGAGREKVFDFPGVVGARLSPFLRVLCVSELLVVSK